MLPDRGLGVSPKLESPPRIGGFRGLNRLFQHFPKVQYLPKLFKYSI
jgi:hypothetical protein